MPRPLRIQTADTLQHIIARGNDKQDLFIDKGDYKMYLQLLNAAKSEHGLKIYNYCLMNNHVHLLVSPSVDGAMAKVMERVTKQYAKYFNKKYGRKGHVFEGRYKSLIIQNEAYFAACMRYIDMNPVKAKLAKSPQDFRWSGFAALGFGRKREVALDQHEYFTEGCRTKKSQRKAYCEMVMNYKGIEVDPLKTHGAIIGDSAFKEKVRKLLK